MTFVNTAERKKHGELNITTDKGLRSPRTHTYSSTSTSHTVLKLQSE